MSKSEIKKQIEENKRRIREIREENRRLEIEKREAIESERIERYSDKFRKLLNEFQSIIKEVKKCNKEQTDFKELDEMIENISVIESQPSEEEIIREKVMSIVNNKNTIWDRRDKYLQVQSEFICPKCNEKLYIRKFNTDRILLTCKNGYLKSGCTYGWWIK